MPLHPLNASSFVLNRSLFEEPLAIDHGKGAKIVLSDGREILDACSGPSVSCLGHSRPDIVEAATAQMSNIAYTFAGSRFTNDPSEELARLLLQDRPGGLSKAVFVSSGSEATDAAIKLATQYWYERKQPLRQNFIARKQSYHGNTIGALCVSGHRSRREIYSSWLSQNVSFVDPCYAYRGKQDGENDEDYVARLKQQLDDEFQRLGPETVAAFIAEPISGTVLGCQPAVPGYFRAMQEVCDKYGALLILDEIMCGMGKTGTQHAWQQEGIRGPDIQTIGKALAGGYVPLSAVLLHEKIFQALANGSGYVQHGHTFQAHPVACAAAVAVQTAIRREGLLENVKTMGKRLQTRLQDEVADLSVVGDIRGRGLYWAVEFVKDKQTKQSFEPADQFCQRVVKTALDLGLNILGNLGDTGEYYVDHVILSPPFTVTPDEIDSMVSILAMSISKVSGCE